MSEFKSINTSIVNGKEFKSLKPGAKLLFFQLLCHPAMNSVGCIRMTFNELADYVGGSPDVVEEICDYLCCTEIIDIDKNMAVISIRDYVRHNRPRNPNIVKSWIKIFKELPPCAPKDISLLDAILFIKYDATDAFKNRIPNELIDALATQTQSGASVIDMINESAIGKHHGLPQNS